MCQTVSSSIYSVIKTRGSKSQSQEEAGYMYIFKPMGPLQQVI